MIQAIFLFECAHWKSNLERTLTILTFLQKFFLTLTEEKKEKMANLTCVLRKMGALDDNLNISLKHFTKLKLV